MTTSLDMINEMASLTVIGTMAATVAITSLLIMLFLHDRKNEVGIYLSLGEKRVNIAGQFLAEIMIATVIGMTLGLLAGNLLSAEVSSMLIEQDMIRQLENPTRVVDGVAPNLRFMGYSTHMSPHEMLETFEVKMDMGTAIQFYSLFLTSAFLAAAIPLMILVRTHPSNSFLLGIRNDDE
ncbi:MAG: FtsX-like permease family protein [Coriobacteriia bacterium]|nr:FtsX-like permease family protein [Coriobacteriia bacterium]MCL2537293.1 FtsX-like permease family protein [Coriobacteriia bacterium]